MPLLLDLRDQTFANQTGFFRDKNSLHLDALDAWTRQRLPAFRLGVHPRDLRLACHKDVG